MSGAPVSPVASQPASLLSAASPGAMTTNVLKPGNADTSTPTNGEASLLTSTTPLGVVKRQHGSHVTPTTLTMQAHSNQSPRAGGYNSGASTSTHHSTPDMPQARTVGGYLLTQVLGEGTFAKVYQGMHKTTQKQYAVKVLQKAELVKQEKGKELLFREINVMQCLKGHKHIVELKEIMQTGQNIYIVMEIVSGGELLTKITANVGMPEDEARKYFHQIISAVDYCHKMHIAHRDIKPENIIVHEDGNIKMTDFGLSNLQKINEQGTVTDSLRLRTICGTPHYVAPEVITDTSLGYNGFSADIWSCGVVLYAMLAGGLPFRGSKPTSILKRISSADPHECEWIPAPAWTLINRLLTKDPLKRMQIIELVEDPWFSVGFDREELKDVSREKTLQLSEKCAPKKKA